MFNNISLLKEKSTSVFLSFGSVFPFSMVNLRVTSTVGRGEEGARENIFKI